ncbi:UNVERIFIED_CONTAM: hypothetical protein GTU68_015144 [Idotea baltica]|nr:hypothetical protein [Idotea baltica]
MESVGVHRNRFPINHECADIDIRRISTPTTYFSGRVPTMYLVLLTGCRRKSLSLLLSIQNSRSLPTWRNTPYGSVGSILSSLSTFSIAMLDHQRKNTMIWPGSFTENASKFNSFSN